MAKTIDRVKTQDHLEKLTEEKRDDFFTNLIMGKDVVEEVETSRGVFVLKYPTAADLISIGKVAAFRRNYKPVEAFDAETEMLITTTSTLDIVVVSGPKWFEDAKTKNKNFTFMEVPSREFIAELYGKAYSFREKIEQSFNTSKEPADKPISAERGNAEAVDGGAFGSLSSEQIDP
jgi:hypothetical protein